MSFFDRDFDITEIVLACLVQKGSGQRIHRDRPSHGLALKCSGKNRYTFDDGTVLTVCANEIVYLPRCSTYRVDDVEIGDCYAINFQLPEGVSFAPFVIRTKDSDAFLTLFKSAERHWRGKAASYRMKCKALLYEVLCKIQGENSGYLSTEQYRRIAAAVAYINEHYISEPLSVEGLARMCDITPEYFRKIFRVAHGISPCKYIANLRLKRMAELLASGMYSVTEAAALSGYEDLSYCSRAFKKKYGVSAREYAKAPR